MCLLGKLTSLFSGKYWSVKFISTPKQNFTGVHAPFKMFLTARCSNMTNQTEGTDFPKKYEAESKEPAGDGPETGQRRRRSVGWAGIHWS